MATLVASSDESKAADKQLSVDLHVCKETLRGKIENLHSEHKRFEGATNSNFRGINPLVPQFKHLTDQCKDMLDYLVKGNQHDMLQQESMRTTMESTGNSEDRMVRVESLCGGLIDQLNEVNELVQQVREAQQLQQEQLTTMLNAPRSCQSALPLKRHRLRQQHRQPHQLKLCRPLHRPR